MTPLADERRSSPRCDVVENRLSIEFTAPEGRRTIGATLVNISRGGALVLADKPMRRAAPLSLRIESPVRTDWMDAEVVRFDPSRQIGLQFTQDCPDDFLLAGSAGMDLAYLVRNEVSGTTAFD